MNQITTKDETIVQSQAEDLCPSDTGVPEDDFETVTTHTEAGNLDAEQATLPSPATPAVSQSQDADKMPDELHEGDSSPEDAPDMSAQMQDLQAVYPHVDVADLLTDTTFRELLSGDVKPTARQVYEMLHPHVLIDALVEEGVRTRLAETVNDAVASAVAETEKNLLRHIQARGMRPPENGRHAAQGVRTHPAVHQLTREDRAKLAAMAQLGNHVRF